MGGKVEAKPIATEIEPYELATLEWNLKRQGINYFNTIV